MGGIKQAFYNYHNFSLITAQQGVVSHLHKFLQVWVALLHLARQRIRILHANKQETIYSTYHMNWMTYSGNICCFKHNRLVYIPFSPTRNWCIQLAVMQCANFLSVTWNTLSNSVCSSLTLSCASYYAIGYIYIRHIHRHRHTHTHITSHTDAYRILDMFSYLQIHGRRVTDSTAHPTYKLTLITSRKLPSLTWEDAVHLWDGISNQISQQYHQKLPVVNQRIRKVCVCIRKFTHIMWTCCSYNMTYASLQLLAELFVSNANIKGIPSR